MRLCCRFSSPFLLLWNVASVVMGFVPNQGISIGGESSFSIREQFLLMPSIAETLSSSTTTSHKIPTSTIGWREIPIDRNAEIDEESMNSSVGERLKAGETVIELNGIVSEEECQYLRQACEEFASQKATTTELEKPGLVRIPTIAASERAKQTRTPCTEPLPSEIDESIQHILRRVAGVIDEELPSLVESLFLASDRTANNHDDPSSLTQQLQSNQLKFSSREPAVNVYTSNGEFLAHKDAQALTVLLPFSSPTVDFDGGGTAFWSQDQRGHRVEDPSIVLKPKAGTCLLFGGCVTHAGKPLLSGTRVVFVASFSPKMGQRQQQQDDSFIQQRDIYGDLL